MKYRKHFAAVAVLVVVGTVLTYIILTAIYQLPVAASTEAVSIDALFDAHFLLISFLFALVIVFMLYSIVVFRRRPDDEEDAEGDHFHGHTGLEIAWTIVPLALVVFFGVWATQVLGEITERKDDEMVVRAIGRQWSWRFEYPEYDDLGSDELVVPVDRPVRLQMESQDVLHSFWVPEFRVKQDLVPGQTTEVRITPSQTGEYKVLCAEICGTGHSDMRAPVRVLSSADFDTWVQEQSVSVAQLSPAERGAQWYTQFGCNACHTVDGTVQGQVGPTWQGLFGSERTLASGETVPADEDYIRNAILNPNDQIVEGYQPNVMPANFETQFAEVEAQYDGEVDVVAEIIAYIQSLEETAE